VLYGTWIPALAGMTNMGLLTWFVPRRHIRGARIKFRYA
jgi:hypothetical protein